MNIALAVAPQPSFRLRTRVASNIINLLPVETVSGSSPTISKDAAEPEPSIDEKLQSALDQAKLVLRSSVRDLGTERAQEIQSQIVRLLDPEDWSDDDEVLKVASVMTLVRVLAFLNKEPGFLTLTRSGNLAATWSNELGKLRVEALPSGEINWAEISHFDGQTRTSHQSSDSVSGLLEALNV